MLALLLPSQPFICSTGTVKVAPGRPDKESDERHQCHTGTQWVLVIKYGDSTWHCVAHSRHLITTLAGVDRLKQNTRDRPSEVPSFLPPKPDPFDHAGTQFAWRARAAWSGSFQTDGPCSSGSSFLPSSLPKLHSLWTGRDLHPFKFCRFRPKSTAWERSLPGTSAPRTAGAPPPSKTPKG